ncbi:endonuclease/exonuclease/phosphatase family metal-dependent hydrolase [Kribbella voronezhensis]|uniref:Endonuclease/exonuclease/phosphatase family metal-dependent hydrolase n=1 Tax=Kribbella voronezhensis TaxID=2512212 RepID=A0A4V3FJ08_9ACTN|nr:endonuclease/exonuclease/phosphatase family protein [Kribbella voronezhensis]TDU84433.1 endonuclease/exonuclease/phosphatase family metal-dependent hydrolase [Kribbella voronezhensis]
MSTLSLATLNVWGTRGDWSGRRDVLTREFAELAPDLITLQETIVTADYDQTGEFLDPAYHVVHQAARESDGQGITTASRWPIGWIEEIDLHLTTRATDFACTALITEVLAPEPIGRIWLANHFPDWQLDHEQERRLQAAATAHILEDLATKEPGHVLVAGDFDAEADADSMRFWTGKHVVNDFSVCYRDAWASAHPTEPGHTFVPGNPHSNDWDWPYRRIDYILIRCAPHGGPTLAVTACHRILDHPHNTVSDHYGLLAELALPPTPTR